MVNVGVLVGRALFVARLVSPAPSATLFTLNASNRPNLGIFLDEKFEEARLNSYFYLNKRHFTHFK